MAPLFGHTPDVHTRATKSCMLHDAHRRSSGCRASGRCHSPTSSPKHDVVILVGGPVGKVRSGDKTAAHTGGASTTHAKHRFGSHLKDRGIASNERLRSMARGRLAGEAKAPRKADGGWC